MVLVLLDQGQAFPFNLKKMPITGAGEICDRALLQLVGHLTNAVQRQPALHQGGRHYTKPDQDKSLPLGHYHIVPGNRSRSQ